MEMTRVRFIKSRRQRQPGDEANLFSNVAKVLIKRGYCVPVDEVETACIAPQEQAVRRRGRPRKVRSSANI